MNDVTHGEWHFEPLEPEHYGSREEPPNSQWRSVFDALDGTLKRAEGVAGHEDHHWRIHSVPPNEEDEL